MCALHRFGFAVEVKCPFCHFHGFALPQREPPLPGALLSLSSWAPFEEAGACLIPLVWFAVWPISVSPLCLSLFHISISSVNHHRSLKLCWGYNEKQGPALFRSKIRVSADAAMHTPRFSGKKENSSGVLLHKTHTQAGFSLHRSSSVSVPCPWWGC